MAKIKTMIRWLRGKKAHIGAILWFVAAACSKVNLEFFGGSAEALDSVAEMLKWVGGIAWGVGWGDKAKRHIQLKLQDKVDKAVVDAGISLLVNITDKHGGRIEQVSSISGKNKKPQRTKNTAIIMLPDFDPKNICAVLGDKRIDWQEFPLHRKEKLIKEKVIELEWKMIEGLLK